MLIGPVLRENTKCLGADDCYPLIYGIFVLAKLIAIFCLTFGKRFAVVRLPEGNMFIKVCGCIWVSKKDLLRDEIN